MKKIVCLLLVLSLIFASGCGQAAEKKGSAADDVQKEPTWAETEKISYADYGSVRFETAMTDDDYTKVVGALTLEGSTSLTSEVNEETGVKTLVFQYLFDRPDDGYSFLAYVVDAYTGVAYVFQEVSGSTLQHAEATIQYSGETFPLSIEEDFIDNLTSGEKASLTYTVTCPIGYDGALFYIGSASENTFDLENENAGNVVNVSDQLWYTDSVGYWYRGN